MKCELCSPRLCSLGERSSYKLEAWLEEMELKGWNLNHVDKLGLRFKFSKGEATKVRYCVKGITD